MLFLLTSVFTIVPWKLYTAEKDSRVLAYKVSVILYRINQLIARKCALRLHVRAILWGFPPQSCPPFAASYPCTRDFFESRGLIEYLLAYPSAGGGLPVMVGWDD